MKRLPSPTTSINIVIFITVLTAFYWWLFVYKADKEKEYRETALQTEKVTTETGALVEGYPDIPVYPGLTVENSYKKEQYGKTDFVTVWRNEGDTGAVMDWYAVELINRGWVTDSLDSNTLNDEKFIYADSYEYILEIYSSKQIDPRTGEEFNIIITQHIEKT